MTSFLSVQLREKAAAAKEEAGGLAPLAHGVLEAQKEEQRKASDLAALKRFVFYIVTDVVQNTRFCPEGQSKVVLLMHDTDMHRLRLNNSMLCKSLPCAEHPCTFASAALLGVSCITGFPSW